MSEDKAVYEAVCRKEKYDDLPDPVEVPKGFGARHFQVLILFICLTVAYSMRAHLSVSMVAMTSHDFGDHGNATGINGTANGTVPIPSARYQNLSSWNVYRKYDWDKKTQEVIQFSFFGGYTIMMIPMGIIAQKFGGKKPIMLALAVNGVISIISPWLPIFGGWIAMSICRFLQGTTQAAFYPSIHTILARWVPLSERGRLSTYVYTGSQFGTVVIFQLAGVFAGSPSLGWPATFWLCGILSFASFFLLWWLGAATPHDHPRISVEEMEFIMEGGSADVVPRQRRTPWNSILTSTAVWGLVASHAGSTVGYLLCLTQIPAYMNFVLGVELKKNGLLSSLPYVAMYFTALLSGYLADYAANRNILSIANIRRVANSIGLVMAGLALLTFSYMASTVPAVIMLVLSMALHSACHVGYHINQIDLAPNFAGPIMALGNMVANLTSLLVPVIVSNIVRDDMSNQGRWQTVFLIIVSFQLVANLVFVIFAKGTVQPWNFHGDEDAVQKAERSNSIFEKRNSVFEKKNSFKLNTNLTKT